MKITPRTPAGTPRFKRLARTLAIGAAALGLSVAALPAAAEDGPPPREVSQRIERIAHQVERVSYIRNPYRQDARIDRLQSRLARLEAITERQRGRRARRNGARIDALQYRLHRMERRAERRIDRREHRRTHWQGYGYGGSFAAPRWRY